jgi:integrase
MELTAKTVAALQMPAGKTDHIEWDDALPGFGHRLRAGTGGKVLRSWVAQYRHAGRTRRLLLGNAAVMTAADARTKAKQVLGRVANGEDPQATKSERRGRDAVTFAGVVRDYLAQKESTARPKTLREIRRYLTDRRYFGSLFALPLDTIGRKDVAARLVAITRDASATTAARAKTQISALFVWAMSMGLADANPVIGTVKVEEPPPRDRVLTDAELGAVWRACGDDDFGKIIRLLILTGARRTEIGGMAWPELDEAAGTWTLPAERAKNGRRHVLPLPATAWAILATISHKRDFVFGVRSPAGFADWGIKAAFDTTLGDAVASWVIHDIRRSVATGMADLGVQPHVIEAVLNHQSGAKAGIAGVYNRSSYEREVRAALALWADHVLALAEDRSPKVVPLRGAV